MKKLQNILSAKSLIIAVGLITALIIVGQPVVDKHFKKTCDKKVEQKSDDTDQGEETLSSLEALSPTHSVKDVSAAYYILEVIEVTTAVFERHTAVLVEKLRTNLIRILFNFIIAPNAP